MSAPHESGHDDEQLVRYLLGQLPDGDAERLDELSVVDEEVASRLAVVETDLVDAYVRGTMPAETRERFEAVYLSSPRRRQKVKFSEGFLRAVDRAAVPVEETPGAPSGASSPLRVVPRSMPWWQLAAAAALLLLAGGSVLFSEIRLQRGLAEAQRASDALDRRAHALEQQLEIEHAANAEAAQELARVRASMTKLTQQSTADAVPGQAAVAPRAPAIVALMLSPQTRGTGPMAAIVVPQGAESVAFELQLDTSDFSRYEAALKDPATDRVVWRSGRITARSAGDLPVVSIVVPAGILKSQNYFLELTGYGAGADAQVVGGYTFRIVRR